MWGNINFSFITMSYIQWKWIKMSGVMAGGVCVEHGNTDNNWSWSCRGYKENAKTLQLLSIEEML